MVEERNSTSVACVGLARAIPPSLTGAGHVSSEVGPFVGHPMSEYCMHSVRLGACNVPLLTIG